MRQKWSRCNFLPALFPSGYGSFTYVSGCEHAIFDSCRSDGGWVVTNNIGATFIPGIITDASGTGGFEFDKGLGWVDVLGGQVVPYIAINAPTQRSISFKGTDLVGGVIRCFGDVEFEKACCGGMVDLREAQRVFAKESRAALVYLYGTVPGGISYVTIDGTTVTFTPATTSEPDIITIPNASAFSGFEEFLGQIWCETGASSAAPVAVLKMFINQSSFYVDTGTYFIIDAITDDENNQYVKGSLYSTYSVTATVATGGTGWAVGNTFTTANGLIGEVATESSGIVETVTLTQKYAATRAYTGVTTMPTRKWQQRADSESYLRLARKRNF